MEVFQVVIPLIVLDNPISLKEYDSGLFISGDGVLCVKTEYGNDSYIVSSGERFWGGTDNDNDLGNLQIYPCYCEEGTSDLLPEVINIKKGNSIRSKHPSYGMIAFDRITSNVPEALFGSSIKHTNPIRLTIRHAEVDRHINCDWYNARGRIIEIEMSQSQFADAITSFNRGDGVPCTILFTERDGNIPECNFVNKVEQFSGEFSEQISGVQDELGQCIKDVSDIFEKKKTLTKAEREKIIGVLQKAKNNVGCNARYVYNCFNEQMDKTVKEAKGEIESFMQNKIRTFAAKAISESTDIDLLKIADNPVEI